MIKRFLKDRLLEKKRSVLLLGPRQTGKSTLCGSLDPDISLNCADSRDFLELAQNPDFLFQLIASKKPKLVFIDEAQKLPRIFNDIQIILDGGRHGTKFLLTGSSARKLRRGRANLLPGRMHTMYLSPLFCGELGFELDTADALAFGMLPGIRTEPDIKERKSLLASYAGTYLQEEIQAESLSRDIGQFGRFLRFAAAYNASVLDFGKLSSESGIRIKTASRYFEILEDTLIADRCEPFAKSEKKRLVQRPKYYFFDTGVLNGLLKNFTPSDDRKGRLFETLIYQQLTAMIQNSVDDASRLSYYRTEHGAEVDFILETRGRLFAIEVKASSNIGVSDLSGLESFGGFYGKSCHKIILYTGSRRRRLRDVEIFPWMEFFRDILMAKAL